MSSKTLNSANSVDTGNGGDCGDCGNGAKKPILNQNYLYS